ncbi:DNA polymerase III subunit [Flavobacterium silvaticum]|uniref:DNA polymerase III subunit delta n=1 Tax=Flavobacterium silvaticum TaxID=1852020 RepID=A0A972JFX0_9FLAO|nr:DNA polymerase III subunit delta' [Flavobacterium silvaticum]NMH28424.1 DNA polymerase III subunit delta' [Flavobacterium silvaticum]
MLFSEILAQDDVKEYLASSADSGRIPHAQLFVGAEGSGTLAMAIAYSQYILCKNESGENNGPNQACNLKFSNFSHPDLHFVYPTVTNEDVKKNPKSLDFLGDWRDFLQTNIYGSLYDWLQLLGVKNQQGEIRVEDANDMVKSMSLKAYEGGYKVMIVWMADKLNIAASNKILKLLEEPTPQSLFILISENEEDILPTIKSRCQVIRFKPLPEKVMADALMEKTGLAPREALLLARQAQGNFNKAQKLVHSDSEENPFEEWFVVWVRAAFRAKGNAAAINDLIGWSEKIASLGRETQKKFLDFCTDMFRQALLLNYQVTPLVYYEPKVEKFRLENFATYVNDKNIADIFRELSDAMYHIERNANAKIVLTDLSIKLTRLIHKQ